MEFANRTLLQRKWIDGPATEKVGLCCCIVEVYAT